MRFVPTKTPEQQSGLVPAREWRWRGQLHIAVWTGDCANEQKGGQILFNFASKHLIFDQPKIEKELKVRRSIFDLCNLHSAGAGNLCGGC